MSYVGGYLDGGRTIATLSGRNRRRLSGADENWARRTIYPLPTSDSRRADFSELGTNDAWIKLAEPTAEAIRQAFLGHRSRIAVEPVASPSMHVVRAEVAGSAILVDTDVEFSAEFNAVIGGRGTGEELVPGVHRVRSGTELLRRRPGALHREPKDARTGHRHGRLEGRERFAGNHSGGGDVQDRARAGRRLPAADRLSGWRDPDPDGQGAARLVPGRGVWPGGALGDRPADGRPGAVGRLPPVR